MEDQTVYWGTSAIVTDPVPTYTVYSETCILTATYDAKVLVNGEWKNVSEVPEVDFNPDTLEFTLAKCSPADLTNDPDCTLDADFYTFSVAAVSSTKEGEMTSSDEQVFDVTFGPDCRDDALSFDNMVSSPQTYLVQG